MKWPGAIILFFEDSATAATDGYNQEGLSGREGFATRAARSLREERTGWLLPVATGWKRPL